MNKYFPLLSLLFVFFMVKNEGIAQDLIEITKQRISKPHAQSTPNQLAKLVQQHLPSKARFSKFDPFEVSTSANITADNFVTGSVDLAIKSEQLNTFILEQPAVTTLKIPVDAKSFFELELFKVDIFSEDFVFRSSDGQNLTGLSEGVYYRGIIKGDNNSVASASIFGDEIRIMIGDDDGNYVIGKRKDTDAHVLYNDRNLLLTQPESCITGEEQDLTKEGLRTQIQSEARNAMIKCVPIYVECDYDMFQKQGNSAANVIAFVGALINEVATIYANEQIEISLSDVKVWTTPDPYASLNSTSAILQKFGELTKNNYNGRLAHFISTRSLGGGIAWVDVLCSSYFTFSGQHAGPYAVSASMGTSITTFPTYSWNVEVFTHEMGHNMGSPHTQNCSWNGNNTAIDACAPTEGGCSSTYGSCPPNGGTIMSYCHILPNCGTDFNNGFGQQPGDLIRNRYNNASCTLTCATPTCDDGVQNGNEEGVDCGGTSCAPCACYNNTINFVLQLDQYANETSWSLKNAAGTPLYSGGDYNSSFATITETFNLPQATGYQFSISDQYGDGICCGFGNGSFTLTDNSGQTIASGGAFGSSFSTTFCTAGGSSVNDICEENVTVNADLLGNNSIIAAQNTLTTSGNIAFNKNVIFKAGQSIILLPGFHAQIGSNFAAMIQDCNPSSIPSDSLSVPVSSQDRIANTAENYTKLNLKISPNPFHSSATIGFILPQKERVKIQVMDVNGRIVKKLVNNEMKEAGYNEISLDRTQLHSGMYYVFLVTKESMISKKIVLID